MKNKKLWLVFGVIALIVIICGTIFAFVPKPQPIPTKAYANGALGMSFTVPSDWVTSSTKTASILQSPDYKFVYTPETDSGNILAGAAFSIKLNTTTAYDDDPQKNTDDWSERYAHSCSNCSDTKQIKLDSIPAVQTTYTSQIRNAKVISIMLVYNKKLYDIKFTYVPNFPNSSTILENFIKGFKFTSPETEQEILQDHNIAPAITVLSWRGQDPASVGISYSNLPKKTSALAVCEDSGPCTEWVEHFAPDSPDGTYTMSAQKAFGTTSQKGLGTGTYKIIVLGSGFDDQIATSNAFFIQ